MDKFVVESHGSMTAIKSSETNIAIYVLENRTNAEAIVDLLNLLPVKIQNEIANLQTIWE